MTDGTILRNYADVLVILMRLRQLCCHPDLLARTSPDAGAPCNTKIYLQWPRSPSIGLNVESDVLPRRCRSHTWGAAGASDREAAAGAGQRLRRGVLRVPGLGPTPRHHALRARLLPPLHHAGHRHGAGTGAGTRADVFRSTQCSCSCRDQIPACAPYVCW